PFGLKGAFKVNHQWGKDNVIPTNVSRVIDRDIPAKEFQKRLKEIQKEGSKLPAMKALAVWALQHGLTREFHKVMAEIKDAKDEMVAAYLKIKADMSQTPTTDPAVKDLLQDLKIAKYVEIKSEQGHYSLFYLPDVKRRIEEKELTRLLDRLERTYE